MSQKSELYNELKNRGLPLTTGYVNYTVAQLQKELATPTAAQQPEPEIEEALPTLELPDVSYPAPKPLPVNAPADPNEMPGQRLNTHQAQDEPIRVDDQGRLWYQEEVRKPAYPKPRGRRVLTYMDKGVEQETVQNGEYVETFEVAGKGAGRPSEVKITLPSYQVGIYKDPRFPFRVHTYNGREGFALFEVQDYYGGAELVPEECKRIYIENDLCYDLRTVIRAITNEHRQLQLTGRIK